MLEDTNYRHSSTHCRRTLDSKQSVKKRNKILNFKATLEVKKKESVVD
jgi:hypothetical protein